MEGLAEFISKNSTAFDPDDKKKLKLWAEEEFARQERALTT
jgi:hypothetical protein